AGLHAGRANERPEWPWRSAERWTARWACNRAAEQPEFWPWLSSPGLRTVAIRRERPSEREYRDPGTSVPTRRPDPCPFATRAPRRHPPGRRSERRYGRPGHGYLRRPARS